MAEQPEQWRRGGRRLRNVSRMLLVLTVIQGLCLIGLGIDLWGEFPQADSWRDLSIDGWVHLASECAMVALVLTGLAVARFAMTRLHVERNELRDELVSLRGEFDQIIQARFDDWKLSAAQKDVALLTLRGLRIAEIASARNCAEGTVKAHLNAIFRAADVHTRNELIGLLMEELLDFGAAEVLPAPSAGRV